MTKNETIKIMAMLGAFYSGGKNDPRAQANAWHLILGKYDYKDAEAAVLRFAEKDTRDYATFPAVGKIVNEIRNEHERKEKAIRDIMTSVQYGMDYNQLSEDARYLIPEGLYNMWLDIEPEEFTRKADSLADSLRNRMYQLEAENEHKEK